MFDSFIHESLKAFRNTTVTESATYFIKISRKIFPPTPFIYFKQISTDPVYSIHPVYLFWAKFPPRLFRTREYPVSFSKSLFKWFDGLFIAVTFVYILCLLALMKRFIRSLKATAIGKSSVTSVFKMTVLNWQSTMQFAMIWSIAVAEFFPTLVGLFIVVIMLYRYIKLMKLCTFLFCS